MLFRRRGIRRAVVGPLSLLLVAVGTAVSVVERADLSKTVALESQHDPSRCPPPHHHTLCSQIGANHASPPARPVAAASRTAVSSHLPGAAPAAPARRDVSAARPRAPPVV